MAQGREELPNPVSVGKYIGKFPAIEWITSHKDEDGYWWVKFHFDINHPTAWNIVQALAYVFTSLSLSDPLPAFFYPTSSPPDMNGGPKGHLHWVIEPKYSNVPEEQIHSALSSSLLFDTTSSDDWLAWPATD